VVFVYVHVSILLLFRQKVNAVAVKIAFSHLDKIPKKCYTEFKSSKNRKTGEPGSGL